MCTCALGNWESEETGLEGPREFLAKRRGSQRDQEPILFISVSDFFCVDSQIICFKKNVETFRNFPLFLLVEIDFNNRLSQSVRLLSDLGT